MSVMIDVMIVSEGRAGLQNHMQTWSDRLVVFRLRLNANKTECLTNDENDRQSISGRCRTAKSGCFQEKRRPSVVEMKMLRWRRGIMRMDRVRNVAYCRFRSHLAREPSKMVR